VGASRFVVVVLGAVLALSCIVILVRRHSEDRPRSSRSTRPVPSTGSLGDESATFGKSDPKPSTPPAREDVVDDQEPPEAEWTDRVPPAYYGRERVEIKVVGPDGEGVAGAHVVCVPALFLPFSKPHFDRVHALSNEQGVASFVRYPLASKYEFVALGPPGVCYLEASHAQATSGDLVANLVAIHYERMEFVDSGDRPVDVSPHHVPTAAGKVLFSSHSFSPGRSLFEAALSYAHPDDQLGDNEFAAFYPSDSVTTPLEPGARVLHLPGFLPVTISNAVRTFAHWPEVTTRIRMRSGSGASEFIRVEFPEGDFPRWWGSKSDNYPPMLVRVVMGRADPVHRGATPNRPFIPLEGVVMKVLLNYRPIPFEMDGSETPPVLRPKLSSPAFLTIRHPSSSPNHPGATCWAVLVDHDGTLLPQGRSIVPGVTRIGPVQPGRYRCALFWSDSPPTLAEMPYRWVELHAGWQDFNWR